LAGFGFSIELDSAPLSRTGNGREMLVIAIQPSCLPGNISDAFDSY
jgi:hypothetical protein